MAKPKVKVRDGKGIELKDPDIGLCCPKCNSVDVKKSRLLWTCKLCGFLFTQPGIYNVVTKERLDTYTVAETRASDDQKRPGAPPVESRPGQTPLFPSGQPDNSGKKT